MRLPDDCEARREQVETLYINIRIMYIQIIEARLRVRQAVERWPGTFLLLSPVLEFLEKWELYILRMKAYLEQAQEQGNERGWREED